MNHRPSTHILSAIKLPHAQRSARSLRWRLLFVAGLSAMVVLGAVAYAGLYVLKRALAGDEDARVENAASLSKQLVERVLSERRRQVEMIASAPSVIAAAKKGGEVSRQRGLPTIPIPRLEEMFKATRSQQVDESTRSFLSDLLPKLDIAEMMVTDQYGLNAVTTSLSSDFVQNDEAWWQTAWTAGHTIAQATADAATQRTVVELADAIVDRGTKIGVVKVKFGLSVVDSVLAQGSTSVATFRVDLVDSLGKVIASSVPSTRFKPFPGFDAIVAHEGSTSFAYKADSSVRHAAVLSTNGGRWRVIAHVSELASMRSYYLARRALIAGIGIMLALCFAAFLSIGRFIERRITGPAQELALAAEAVAGGDPSKGVGDSDTDDEIGRLRRAVAAMIEELRRLAMALK